MGGGGRVLYREWGNMCLLWETWCRFKESSHVEEEAWTQQMGSHSCQEELKRTRLMACVKPQREVPVKGFLLPTSRIAHPRRDHSSRTEARYTLVTDGSSLLAASPGQRERFNFKPISRFLVIWKWNFNLNRDCRTFYLPWVLWPKKFIMSRMNCYLWLSTQTPAGLCFHEVHCPLCLNDLAHPVRELTAQRIARVPRRPLR